MLTRSFLLTWYISMMSRIEQSSIEIRKHFNTIHVKDDNTLVTDVDLKSHHILTDKWTQTPIISEETYSPEQASNSILTWVDPLDATKEYTEGLTEFVSVMACLTENGRPKAGILHFPFRNETWAVINDEWIERPALSMPNTETIIVSRSHAGNIQKQLTGYNIRTAGGSGYKMAEVLKGNALAYIHATTIKTWDICALDILTTASGGTMVEWQTGRAFNFTTNKHTRGLFLSKMFTKQWFNISLALRKPHIQSLIVLALWYAIYLYPDNINTNRKHAKSSYVSFFKCAALLISSYVIWAIAKERIITVSYDGKYFQWPGVLILLNRLSSCMFAQYYNKSQTTPLFQFSVASFTNIISSFCQYGALKYAIFPIVVVFKSLKIIPVILVGSFFFQKRYNIKAYLLAVIISIGIGLCLFPRYKSFANEQSLYGILLLLGYIFADAITSQWQSHLFQKYKTPPIEMMYGVNLCSLVFIGTLTFISGQLNASIYFCTEHPLILLHLAFLCLPSIVGQWFIYKTIEHHGAVAFSMVMSSRQVMTIVLSGIIFKHTFLNLEIAGFIVVFIALFIKTHVSIEDKNEYRPIPQDESEIKDHV